MSPAIAIASVDILKEPQGAKPPSKRYNTRVGPQPPSLMHPRPPRRERLLSGPGHLAWGSLHVPGPSLHIIQLLRFLHGHRLNYPLLRELGVYYFTMTRYSGMWIIVPRTFMESPIMIYQHWQRTHGSEILWGWSTIIRCCRL